MAFNHQGTKVAKGAPRSETGDLCLSVFICGSNSVVPNAVVIWGASDPSLTLLDPTYTFSVASVSRW